MTKREPRSCDLCHGPIEPGQRGLLCQACAAWDRYWASLTPAEQDDEYAMMADYAAEMAGQP